MLLLAILALAQATPHTLTALPTLTVTTDDTRITKSCRVVIPPGVAIADNNGNGVLQIETPGITVEFAPGAVLRGSAPSTAPETRAGIGIRVRNARGVTIRNARIAGFRCALHATGTNELTLEDIDASANFAQALASTPQAENTIDWLRPHDNDNNEYLTRYGAALYVEDAQAVIVRRCRVRQGQNGLVLDRVARARVYDNDFSFNSGWGIALWRVTDSIIARNACDFCIRGYSHGVYNRGQDSAGILMFEQCNNNIIAENSATHSGDGIFAFAGREALGEANPRSESAWYAERGHRGNRIVRNDFSYAAAHGIELTFSFDNEIRDNRLVGNAICGIWGGYSSNTRIVGNEISDNGDMPYGLERGGINIEHGRDNRIVANEFADNACGVHLWWDPDEPIAKLPWAQANSVASSGNLIAKNTFRGCAIALQFRGPNEVVLGDNTFDSVGQVVVSSPETTLERRDAPLAIDVPRAKHDDLPGQTRPVGARPHLRGRDKIIMTPYGPWDHVGPLVRLVARDARQHTYELRNLPLPTRASDPTPALQLESDHTASISATVQGGTARFVPEADHRGKLVVKAAERGLTDYTLAIAHGDYQRTIRDRLFNTRWQARFFTWDDTCDPREDYDAWTARAQHDTARAIELDTLELTYGMGGPSSLDIGAPGLPANHFGMIATTTVPLPAGDYRVTTLSDDGVRVRVNGEVVLENWTWHAPERDSGVFTVVGNDNPVDIIVEHFEIDGYSVLELQLAPAP